MNADLIIKNAYVYLTFRQCFVKRDVAVAGDRFYQILPKIPCAGEGEKSDLIGADTQIMDAGGSYMIPGLIDIHMHIESSMTYPEEFSRIVLPQGTTTVVADAHEIANVFGLEGIRTFMDQKTDLDVFYAIPSSVPATDWEFETAGAEIGEAETTQLLKDERVLCLGEVMNFQQLTKEAEPETKIRRLVRLCRDARGRDIRLEGHCPKISGPDLNRFIAAGIDADHTQQTSESVIEKSDLGMFLELQHKSLTPEVVKTVDDHQLYENIALVTDDTMPDLLMEGQLNRIVHAAIANGMPVEKAIYCATYTPARRMHLDDRGMIAPGKLADFILLDDLQTISPRSVYKSGKCVEKKDWQASHYFPKRFYQSVLCRKAEPADFVLTAERADCRSVLTNVMKIHEFGTMTEAVQREIPVRDGVICWQEAGLCLAVIYERHGKNGNVARGLVEGAFSLAGAVATTWSHDSHNLFVLGNSPEDMLAAQQYLIAIQGGCAVAENGAVTAKAWLPVAGILSDGPVEEIARELGEVRAAMERLGYRNNNVIMSMATLALPVSPALKLTDRGLLDVKTQQPVPLVAACI